MLSFFDLYERVRRFQNTVKEWKNHHADTWGRTLIKKHIAQMVQWHIESARWLFQYSYIQCDGESDECNRFEYAGTLQGIEVLWSIEAGHSNQDYTKKLRWCGDRWWNGKSQEINFPRSPLRF